MKKLLLFLILLNQLSAITIKLIDETDTSNIDLNTIYKNYTNGVVEVEERHIGSVAKFDLNDKSSNKFFIGAFYSSNLSGISTLKNSEEERIGTYTSQPIGGTLGVSMESADLYLTYMQNTLSTAASYTLYGAGLRYKMMITSMLYPYIAVEAGYATTSLNVSGASVEAVAGLGLDVSFFSLKIGYAWTNIYWDYPVVGVTNTFREESIKADASIKF